MRIIDIYHQNYLEMFTGDCHTSISDKPVIVSIASKFIIANIPTTTQVHNNSSSSSLFPSNRPTLKPEVYVYLLLYFAGCAPYFYISKGHAPYYHTVQRTISMVILLTYCLIPMPNISYPN